MLLMITLTLQLQLGLFGSFFCSKKLERLSLIVPCMFDYMYRAQVAKLLPPSLVHLSTPDEWVAGVSHAWNTEVKTVTQERAKRKYLGMTIIDVLHTSSTS